MRRVLWLCLLALSHLNGLAKGHYVENDDFCDDLERGEDEHLTSACSGVAGTTVRFKCGLSNSTSIPLSRVGDGVCDCCDGSDERGADGESPCPDVCARQQMDAKMEALAWHRYVQTGVRKRQEMVNAMRRKKTREVKTLETLRQDYANVRKVSLDLRYWLRGEETKESSKHFELLRERERRCITGIERYCDYWQPTFLSDDEMWVENAPEGYMASTRARVSRERTQREIDYKNSLSALERVRSSTCDAPDIIPDETLKIHSTAGEYLAFQTSPGGVAMRKRTPQQHRKDTFFVKFLEGGPNSHLHGLLAIGEVLSMAALPVSLPLYLLNWLAGQAWEASWTAIERCAESTTVVDTSDSNDDASSTTTTYPAPIATLCVVANDTRVPGTVPFEVVQFFDYTSYSYPMYLLDNYISPALKWPYVVARLVWRAPLMYFDYYLMRRFYDLPPTRNTCMLRSALQTVEDETNHLRVRIKEENDLLLSLAEAEADLGGTAHIGDAVMDAEESEARLVEEEFLDAKKRVSLLDFFSRKSSQRKKAVEEKEKQRQRRIVDYGDKGEYEALRNLCVVHDTSSSSSNGDDNSDADGGASASASRDGSSVWELCFYKRVTAGNTVLGKWSAWGPLLPLDDDFIDSTSLTDGSTSSDSEGAADASSSSGGSGVGDSLAWLGGLAGAIRGVKVDKVQLEIEARRRATRGYWQFQTYADGAACDGSDLLLLSSKNADGDDDDDDVSTAAPAASSGGGAGGGRRSVQVSLQCGHETRIKHIHTHTTNPCISIITVETPLSCDARAEKLSVDRLDQLGVFGFSKRSSATDTQSKVLAAAEEKKKAAEKRLLQQQLQSGDAQKRKEEEAFKASALERKKKALGKMAARSLKQADDNNELGDGSGEEADGTKKSKKKKKKGKGKKKKKKMGKKKVQPKKRGEEQGPATAAASGTTTATTTSTTGGGVVMDVVEGVEDPIASARAAAAGPVESEDDIFDSLPDDDYDEEGGEDGEESEEDDDGDEEVIELDVGAGGTLTDRQKVKIVGGLARPMDG